MDVHSSGTSSVASGYTIPKLRVSRYSHRATTPTSGSSTIQAPQDGSSVRTSMPLEPTSTSPLISLSSEGEGDHGYGNDAPALQLRSIMARMNHHDRRLTPRKALSDPSVHESDLDSVSSNVHAGSSVSMKDSLKNVFERALVTPSKGKHRRRSSEGTERISHSDEEVISGSRAASLERLEAELNKDMLLSAIEHSNVSNKALSDISLFDHTLQSTDFQTTSTPPRPASSTTNNLRSYLENAEHRHQKQSSAYPPFASSSRMSGSKVIPSRSSSKILEPFADLKHTPEKNGKSTSTRPRLHAGGSVTHRNSAPELIADRSAHNSHSSHLSHHASHVSLNEQDPRHPASLHDSNKRTKTLSNHQDLRHKFKAGDKNSDLHDRERQWGLHHPNRSDNLHAAHPTAMLHGSADEVFSSSFIKRVSSPPTHETNLGRSLRTASPSLQSKPGAIEHSESSDEDLVTRPQLSASNRSEDEYERERNWNSPKPHWEHNTHTTLARHSHSDEEEEDAETETETKLNRSQLDRNTEPTGDDSNVLHALPQARDQTVLKTPRFPGSWATPGGPSSFNSHSNGNGSNHLTLPPVTPAPPGGWVPTPLQRKGILKVRFNGGESVEESLADTELSDAPSDASPQPHMSTNDQHPSAVMSEADISSSAGIIRPKLRIVDASGEEIQNVASGSFSRKPSQDSKEVDRTLLGRIRESLAQAHDDAASTPNQSSASFIIDNATDEEKEMRERLVSSQATILEAKRRMEALQNEEARQQQIWTKLRQSYHESKGSGYPIRKPKSRLWSGLSHISTLVLLEVFFALVILLLFRWQTRINFTTIYYDPFFPAFRSHPQGQRLAAGAVGGLQHWTDILDRGRNVPLLLWNSAMHFFWNFWTHGGWGWVSKPNPALVPT